MEALTPEELTRVAKRVRDRRVELGLTQKQAVARAGHSDEVTGVSAMTWRKLERRQQSTFRDLTLAAIARALEWSHDSIDRIRRGEEPLAVHQQIDVGPLVTRIYEDGSRQVLGDVTMGPTDEDEELLALAGEADEEGRRRILERAREEAERSRRRRESQR